MNKLINNNEWMNFFSLARQSIEWSPQTKKCEIALQCDERHNINLLLMESQSKRSCNALLHALKDTTTKK